MKRFLERAMRSYGNVNIALADQALISGVNFATTILLARYLGLQGLGLFTLVWSFTLLSVSIQEALITDPMMSLGPQQPQRDRPTFMGALIGQQLILSVVLFPILLTGIELVDLALPHLEVGGLGLPFACATIAYQFQNFVRRYFFSRERAFTAWLVDGLRYGGQIVVLISLFEFFPDYRSSATVLWIIAFTALTATVISLVAVERPDWNISVFRNVTARHWKYSRWLLASVLMSWAMSNFFIFATGAVLGTTAVGGLRAAQNLMGLCNVYFHGLGNVIHARGARLLYLKGRAALHTYLLNSGLIFGAVTVAIAVVAAAAPGYWLELVYGEASGEYGFLLSWYAVIYVFLFIQIPLKAFLRSTGNTFLLFRANAFSALFTIVASYPLAAYFGLTGVIGGIFVSNLIVVGALAIAVAREPSEIKWSPKAE